MKDVASRATAPNRRWWLWMTLLGVAAWLALFGDKSPRDGSTALSLPTRAPAPSAVAAQVKPGALTTPEPIGAVVPRERLIAKPTQPTSGAKSPALLRDLFSSKNWNPPPPPPSVLLAAPAAPPLPFVFMGKKLEGEGWEVYLSRGEQTLIVREGMTVDGTYRVDKIAPPSLALTYLPLGQAQTLSIGEAR